MAKLNSKALQRKIDFIAYIMVNYANPNGDPLEGNRPRTDSEGYGEISDVCIKRKLRNRLQDMGLDIFVQSDGRANDGYKCLKERANSEIKDYKDADDFADQACEKWIDVRSFGQVFAYKSKKKGEGSSIPVRGPVTICQGRSVDPVDVINMQITKSVNSEPTENGGKSSDTMGTKSFVKFGLYKVCGAINVQPAEKTGFTEDDAKQIKEALKTLFVNDASAARPDGSMEVVRLYWFEHNCKAGQYSSASVQRSVQAVKKDGVTVPNSIDDYEFVENELPGLKPDVMIAF